LNILSMFKEENSRTLDSIIHDWNILIVAFVIGMERGAGDTLAPPPQTNQQVGFS